MNPYRRELITTNIISDEEYIRQWQAVVYNGKDFTNDMQEIITERGEIVRSKSILTSQFLKCHKEKKCIWNTLD